MRIAEIDDSGASAWNEFLDQRSDGSLYHRYEWRDFFEGYFGKETRYLAAVDSNGSFRGVLPLVRLTSVFFGDFLVSLPFVNYGGVVATSPEIADELMAAAEAIGRQCGVSYVEYRHVHQKFALPSRKDKVAMCLRLPASVEDLGRLIGSKRRSQVRRPLREKPEILVGGSELIEDFYTVFSRNMRDLGTPAYARSMFAYLIERFHNDTSLVVIRVLGRPAAAAFLVHNGERMEIPWASTISEFNRISINMLLYWEVLRYAIESRHKVFDFGRSTVGSGTYRFKKQWGAEPVQLNWHYWLAKGSRLPQLNPENRRYGLAIEAWKRLPLPLANALGPRIVRHLP